MRRLKQLLRMVDVSSSIPSQVWMHSASKEFPQWLRERVSIRDGNFSRSGHWKFSAVKGLTERSGSTTSDTGKHGLDRIPIMVPPDWRLKLGNVLKRKGNRCWGRPGFSPGFYPGVRFRRLHEHNGGTQREALT
ncbi:predicted protein [Histoplasma capsulatum var. duboisii H88]|uniref:Predicted protein n=1 Tax=Ajellomyces capsulatus (strain H88) TaxID=544711 RepID=F0UAC9_AJEC8|nr:predicted protein [Histoplasma capsulatum var. duboisii H88]